MRDGFKVIDADRHVLEPTDLFEKYLPAKFRDRVKIEGPNQSRRSIDGEPISDADKMRDTTKQEDFGFTFGASKRWRETFADALAAKFDAPSNVRDMDREGVDVSVLFPTLGLYIMWRDNLDPELSAAICRAYNTWLADYCSYDRTAAARRLPDPAAGSGAGGRRAALRQRKTRSCRNLLAPQQALRSNAFKPRLLSDLRSRRRSWRRGMRARGRAHGARASRLGSLQRVRPARRLPSARTDARQFEFLRRRRAGKISQAQSRLFGIGLRLGAVLARAHG